METVLENKQQLAIRDDSAILQQSNQLVDKCNSLVIQDDLSAKKAVELEHFCKDYLSGPATIHDEIIDGLHKLHALACGKRNVIVDPVKKAWKALKDRRAVWQDEQIRKHEEETRKAEAEARRIEEEKQAKIQAKIDEENRRLAAIQFEEERIRKAKEAELAKVKDAEKREQLRKQEESRRAAEEARIEQERIKAASKTEKLEAKKEAVYVAPKVIQAASIPAGASIQYTYEVEVTNKALVPDLYKIVDEAGLVRDQKSRRGALEVPGVRFIKKPIGSTRATKAA